MRYILRKLPYFEKRQSMLFSATLSYRVLELTYEFMNLPEFISVTPDEVTVEGIEQSLFHVGNERKFQLLLGLLQREEFARMLIFVNMKIDVERLARRLKANGLPAEGITGDLPQRQRFKLMERFKNGQIKILLATDVASRGIHVEDISHVINYDLPQDAENYIHRIGRTARAGKTGKAISLACEEYVLHLEPIEEILGYKIPVVWPEDDWFLEDRSRPEDRERRRFERQWRAGRRAARATGRATGDGGRPGERGPERPRRRGPNAGGARRGPNARRRRRRKPPRSNATTPGPSSVSGPRPRRSASRRCSRPLPPRRLRLVSRSRRSRCRRSRGGEPRTPRRRASEEAPTPPQGNAAGRPLAGKRSGVAPSAACRRDRRRPCRGAEPDGSPEPSRRPCRGTCPADRRGGSCHSPRDASTRPSSDAGSAARSFFPAPPAASALPARRAAH